MFRIYIASIGIHGRSKIEGIEKTNVRSGRVPLVPNIILLWPGDRNYLSRDQHRFNSITCSLFVRRFRSHGDQAGTTVAVSASFFARPRMYYICM